MPVFKGIADIGSPLLNEQLQSNIVSYFNWGMLGIGAFFNVNNPQSGIYGGFQNQLRLSEDPNFLPGQVFEGFRQDWVYESGIERLQQPIPVTGVYVNNNFIAATGGSFYVNYPYGRIIFNDPIPTGSVVTCAYSYRYYNFSTPDAPWYQDLFFNSFRVDDPQFQQYGSGVWAVPPEIRKELPAVVVQCIPRRIFIPRQIGGGTTVRQDVGFHIFTETDYDRSQIIDVISYQFQSTINLYDKNALYNLQLFPLDENGNIAASAVMYPVLVDPNGPSAWRKLSFVNFSVEEQKTDLPLYRAFIRGTIEIDMGEIG